MEVLRDPRSGGSTQVGSEVNAFWVVCRFNGRDGFRRYAKQCRLLAGIKRQEVAAMAHRQNQEMPRSVGIGIENHAYAVF